MKVDSLMLTSANTTFLADFSPKCCYIQERLNGKMPPKRVLLRKKGPFFNIMQMGRATLAQTRKY